MSDFVCNQCGATEGGTCEVSGETVEGLTPPVPNKYWKSIAAKVCAPRWAQWHDMRVKIINEYRLNMLEKEHRVLLKKHMTDFLDLDGTGKAGEAPSAVAEAWKPTEG